jgi:DNA-binding response OmpR family regulator
MSSGQAQILRRRPATNGNRHAPARRRVLLFDGHDPSVTSAAPALVGLGIDVVRADVAAPLARSDDQALAVVVAAPSGTAETTKLVRHLRAVGGLPVLLLAPHAQDDVLLQEMPALVPLELVQQVRAILRRAPTRVLRFGLLEIDVGGREVRVDEHPVELSRREFDLLAFLASSPSQAFTRRELLVGVWFSSGAWQTPSTVTEHVRRIRLKLHIRPDLPEWLVTVRGTGYRFEPGPPGSPPDT